MMIDKWMFSKRQNDLIAEYKESGDYTNIPFHFGNSGNPNAFHVLQILFHEIPDNQKYQIVIDIYTNLHKLPRGFKKYLTAIEPLVPKNVTETIKDFVDDSGYLTIYRGGVEVKSPAFCPSWTTSQETANWFAKRFLDMKSTGDTVVYRGVIKATDIIGYTNDRQEQEIIQYRRVKNIEVYGRYENLHRKAEISGMDFNLLMTQWEKEQSEYKDKYTAIAMEELGVFL